MLYALVNLTSPVGHSSNSLHLFSSSIPALENIVPSPPLPNSLEVFAQINACNYLFMPQIHLKT